MTAGRFGAAWLGEGGPEDEGEAASRKDAAVRELRSGIERLGELLGNASFVERAPPSVVERERSRLAELETRLQRLEAGGG